MSAGTLTTNRARLGGNGNGSGLASITGGSSVWNITQFLSSDLEVGYAGFGRLNISGGADVTVADDLIMALGASSTGIVDVRGSGSTLNLTGVDSNLVVGFQGSGTFNMSNQAAAATKSTFIGDLSSGLGKLALDSEATLTNTDSMIVGNSGTGNLEIRGGASATVGSSSTIGSSAGSDGHVLVDGSNSLWDIATSLEVGNQGSSQLEISDGGRVQNTQGIVADELGSGGSVIVRGIGSIWDNSSTLQIADLGAGTLLIAEGASVENTTGDIGTQNGSTGTVTVEGLGSSWTNSSSIDIGDAGTGTLNINSGSTVVNTSGNIGNQSSGIGTVNVNGGGSTWTSSGNLRVGAAGDGTLNITGGGIVSATGVSTDVIVADEGGSVGSLSISGAGSTLVVGNDFVVGDNDGGTGTATIGTGGVVNVPDTTRIGFNSTLTLDGGILTTTAFTNGSGTFNHNRGTMVVDGGAFNPGNSYSLNGSAGTANLELKGSGISDFDFLNVGTTGAAVLNLQSGHQLTLTEGNLGASGEFVLDGGHLLVETFNDFAGGTFTFQSGTLTVNGDVFGSSGSFTIPSAGTLDGQGFVEAEVYGQVGSTISVTSGKYTLGNPFSYLGFAHEGTLNLGANNAELDAAGFAQLGVLTTLAGGTLEANNGVALGLGDNLTGFGDVDTHIAAGLGSTISASGNLTLGNSGSPIGFSSEGILNVGSNTVTIHDLNAADLGVLTTLTTGGTLNIANGAVLDFVDNVTGEGTIQSPNDSSKPIINNGSIVGNGPGNQITLTGYIKGVGSCDNCNITGTDAPGFSPAAVNRGSVSYNGTLEIELGGTTPGSNFDQVNHILGAGIADLGGTLDVQLIDGFVPSAGDTFEIITGTNILDTFDALNLPSLPGDLLWFINYSATSVNLVSTYATDFDEDGDVDDDDLIAWESGFGNPPAIHMTGDANADTFAGGFDFLKWQQQFGMAGATPASLSSVIIPEPSSILLACLAGGIICSRRRLFYRT